ncbi:hypothetical protein [Thalassospira sp.]|jgi:hypothetical protein|uniref:hypothetical protein n=1 Tax=Thalassospira sp. TaxID=1912094 RepID=UPI00262A0097|nr:hypothetical protein [Thalassospira sp.]MCH2275196.1 hypothetical protein [Thalassospira sp.]
MGWKGTLRSVAAASRRAQREGERRQKLAAKLQQLEDAKNDVDNYETYIREITSLHKRVCVKPIDWSGLKKQSKPIPPVRTSENEEKARLKLESFRPNLFHRLFGLEKKRRENLEKNVQTGRQRDQDNLLADQKDFEKALAKYEKDLDHAKKLEVGDAKTMASIIKNYGKFSDIEHIGTNLSFRFEDGGKVFVDLNVHGEEIVPDEKYSLRQSGALSAKKMPKGEFNLLYQDYVCSAMIRVAREVLNLIPVTGVVVNATDQLLNPATGHLEKQNIASVYFVGATLTKLNLQSIDPSDAMTNFLHKMSFKKTTGFQPVEEVIVPH